MAALSVNDQLAGLQTEISKVSAKIECEENKPKSERDPTDLAAWRKKEEQLRQEKLLFLQTQQQQQQQQTSGK
jgi:uncharacterized protein YaiL (DUF2058 family)